MARPKGKARPAKRTRTKKKGFIRKALGPKPATTAKKRPWAWRLAKGTAKGTVRLAAKHGGKAARAAGTKIKTFRDNRKFPDDYTPEPGEIPKGRRARTSTTVGGKRFDTPEAAMAYAERVGSAEPEVKRAERPTGSLEWGKRGKVRVRPATTRKPPAGRHRPSPRKTRVEALIAAHRDKLTKIGSVAVSENEVAKKLKKAFQELDDNKPRKLSQMEELALGMEQVHAFASEVVANYRLFLIQKGFDPADLMPLVNVGEKYDQAALEWTKYIVVIKDNLSAEIAAAKRRRTGIVPDDETLAG